MSVRKALSDFALGFGFLRSGFQIIKEQNSGLKIWVAAPLAIDAVFLFCAFYFGWGGISQLTELSLNRVLSAEHGFWHTIFYYPLFLAFWVVFLILLVYVTSIFAVLIATPFMAVLAEKTWVRSGGQAPGGESLKTLVAYNLRMFKIALLKTVCFLFLGVLLFGFSFAPGLNLLAGFAAFLILAYDSMDYSFDLLELNLKQRFQFVRDHFIVFCGMASVFSLTLLIPGLTLLLQPFAVAGSARIARSLTRGPA